MSKELKFHYLVVAQYQKILADYAKGKGSFEQITTEILKTLQPGRMVLPKEQ